MTRTGRAIGVLVVSIALGLALTLASYSLAVRRGVIPDPGVLSTTELRGWPAGYALELAQPVPEPGVRIRFEEQWVPSFVDDAWSIGRWAGFYFVLDWVLLGATCAAALCAFWYLVGRVRTRVIPAH
jgi:hypothetical protein